MSWFGLGFFAGMVYALSLYPDTAIGLALTPIWFIALAIGYEILTRRHAAKRARVLATGNVVDKAADKAGQK